MEIGSRSRSVSFWCTCSLTVLRTAGLLSFRCRLALVCPSNGRSACQRRRVIPVMDCVSIPSPPPHEDRCCNSERQARTDRRHNPRRQLTASSGSSAPATTAQLGRKPDAPKNGRSEPLGGFWTPEGTGWMQSGGLKKLLVTSRIADIGRLARRGWVSLGKHSMEHST